MKRILNDRLLTIEDVSEMTGLCRPIASKLIDESGHAINVHRRKFILESGLLEYLKDCADRRHNKDVTH
ncbi:hypothetical protein [Raoultibacter phocaeensis]|uniref:hypothetical protein n=1 Tax=Raoultibacter phocaeensis TaxID=2479841 RepID=UPI0011188824|nr:hypothetical protein [Raoultibacter phocaeensis]